MKQKSVHSFFSAFFISKRFLTPKNRKIQFLDTFSVSRVKNVLRRLGNEKKNIFETEISENENFKKITTRIELYSAHGNNNNTMVLKAVGEVYDYKNNNNENIKNNNNNNIKQSEILAAMHAEDIINYLNISLFSSTKLQKKYYEQKKKEYENISIFVPENVNQNSFNSAFNRNSVFELLEKMPPPLFYENNKIENNEIIKNENIIIENTNHNPNIKEAEIIFEEVEFITENNKNNENKIENEIFVTEEILNFRNKIIFPWETKNVTPQKKDNYFHHFFTNFSFLFGSGLNTKRLEKLKKMYRQQNMKLDLFFSKNNNHNQKNENRVWQPCHVALEKTGAAKKITEGRKNYFNHFTILLPYLYDKEDAELSLNRIKNYVETFFYNYHFEKKNENNNNFNFKQYYTIESISDRQTHSLYFVAEIRIPFFSENKNNNNTVQYLIASGKAMNAEVALHLAAMHAELLIDYDEINIFLEKKENNNENENYNYKMKQLQKEKYKVVKGLGRWCYDPNNNNNKNKNKKSLLFSSQPPLPLKQTSIFEEYLWLDNNLSFFYAPEKENQNNFEKNENELLFFIHRTLGERMCVILLFIHYLNIGSLEVSPSLLLLEEAYKIFYFYVTRIIKNENEENFHFHNLFFISKRGGDAFRCDIIIPTTDGNHNNNENNNENNNNSENENHTINIFNIRGGSGVGRTEKEAIFLAILHFVDTIYFLGLPFLKNNKNKNELISFFNDYSMVRKEKNLMYNNVWNEMITENNNNNNFNNFTYYKQSVWSEGGISGYERFFHHNFLRLEKKNNENENKIPFLLPYYSKTAATNENNNTTQNNNNNNNLPNIKNVLRVLSLNIPSDFIIINENKNSTFIIPETILVSIGNDVKFCVMAYMRELYFQQNRNYKSENIKINHHENAITDLDVLLLEENDSLSYFPTLNEMRKKYENINNTVLFSPQIITYPGITFAYLEIPHPYYYLHENKNENNEINKNNNNNKLLLAVGAGLRRKDAERMCFLHAASLLLHIHENNNTNNENIKSVDVLAKFSLSTFKKKTNYEEKGKNIDISIDCRSYAVVEQYLYNVKDFTNNNNNNNNENRDNINQNSVIKPFLHGLADLHFKDPSVVAVSGR